MYNVNILKLNDNNEPYWPMAFKQVADRRHLAALRQAGPQTLKSCMALMCKLAD